MLAYKAKLEAWILAWTFILINASYIRAAKALASLRMHVRRLAREFAARWCDKCTVPKSRALAH